MDDVKKRADLPIKWRAEEYQYKPKSNEWFWVIGSGVLILIVAAILMRNFLLGIFAVVAGFTIAVCGTKRPKNIEFEIEVRGIKIGPRFYPNENLNSFWINYDPPRKKELILESKKMFMPHIKIPLADMSPGLIKERLSKFLKEEKYEESLIDTVTDWLGF